MTNHVDVPRSNTVKTAGGRREPSFLVIGAQRSGSTFLSECLRAHPEVFLPNGEVEYFEDPVYQERHPSFLNDIFAGAPQARVYGFKRPELLARPECPARIARELPGVRMIAVLRDPVWRTVSAYFHYAQGPAIPLLPLNEGLTRIMDGEFDKQYPLARLIIQYSMYGEQLTRYRERFDAKSIQVLFDHELTGQTDTIMRRVFNFIGVDPEVELHFSTSKANVGAYSLPRLRFLRLVSPLGYSYQRGSEFGRARTNPVSLAAYKIASRFDRMVLARVVGDEKPALDEAVRDRLVEFFRPDAQRLRALVGPLPSEWGLL